MAEFYYLLGAGASCEIIPTVKGFSAHMANIGEYNKITTFVNKSRPINIIKDYFLTGEFAAELRKIHSTALAFQKFGSPDIYAKYLFINKDDGESHLKLIELKNHLTFFIQLVEYLKLDGNPDHRYFEFIAQIIGPDGKLPKNMTLISWNYDNQFEIALNNFRNNPNWNTILYDERANYTPAYEPFLYKLNGGAYHIFTKEKAFLSKHIPKTIDEEFLKELKAIHEASLKVNETGIKFAFEENSNEFNLLTNKIKHTSQIQKFLTVIGYSFPVFNRVYDKLILKSLRETGLTKIFIQDPNSSEIKRKILGFFEDEEAKRHVQGMFEIISETNAFHIPMEFTPQYSITK